MDEQQKENVQRTKPGPPRSAVEKRSVVVSRQLRTTEHRTNKLETNPAMFTIRTKISDHPTNRAVMVKINRKLTNRFAEIFGEKESNLVADSKRTGMSIVSSTRAMTSTETTNSTAITAPPAEKTPTQVSSRGLTPTFENIRSIENHSNAGTPIQLNSMVKSKRTAKEILPEAATSRTAITTPPAEKTLMKTVPTVFSTAITIPNFQDIRSTQNHSNDSSPNESKPTIKSIIAITSSSSANEAQGTPMVKSEEPSFHSIPNLPPALNFEEAFEMVAAYFRNQTQQTTTIDSSNYGAADEQQDPEVQNLDNFPAVVSSSSPSEPDHFDMEKTVKTISNLFVDFTNDITATVTQISEKHSSQQSAQNGKIDHLGKYIKEEFEKLFKAIQYCIKKSNNESHSKMEVAIREMKTEQDQKHEIMMKKLDEKLETMMQKLDNVANATKPEVISIEERLKINDFETEQKSVEANKLAPQTSSNSSKSSNECPKILPAQGSSTKTSRKRSTTSTSESAVPIKKDRKRMTCAWCGGRHFETDCSTFTRWSERLFVAQRKHLCLNCVRHKNDVACRKPPQICHCGANHFRALCPIRFP